MMADTRTEPKEEFVRQVRGTQTRKDHYCSETSQICSETMADHEKKACTQGNG